MIPRLLAQGDPIGNINPPGQIANFTKGTGAAGLSLIFSNILATIISLSMIVALFVIIYGSIQWMTSGGDKEQIASARSRIITALIGIVLLAVAFVLLNILGKLTGFTFIVPRTAVVGS